MRSTLGIKNLMDEKSMYKKREKLSLQKRLHEEESAAPKSILRLDIYILYHRLN